MPNNPLNEHHFQRLIIEHLVQDNGYVERRSQGNYDPALAMDTQLLLDFLQRTQPEEMERVRRIYDGSWKATVLNTIDQAIRRQGLVQCLWDGVELERGIKLDLVEPRPSALFDKRASDLFAENVLSVEEEVWHTQDERIDLVIFLNGLAIFTIELKCNTSGTKWDYRDAIAQYKERDCTSRLLAPYMGALAHFAMDLHNVYVCAELKRSQSTFLPFNKGTLGEGATRETGPGNPPNPNGIDTSYMWEEILTRDTVFDLIYDFVFVAKRRDKRSRKVVGRYPIFPRYQQLRAVRRVVDDIQRNGTDRDYLIEHSAGSGKTNTISWLAHKLASLYAEGSDDPLFDKVIVVTDRKVVDAQLQNAVLDMAKDPAVVRVMGPGKKSSDLADALGRSYRIVVSTMEKFLYLPEGTFSGTGKRFAVLIDEAHGSTSGETMAAVDAVLSSADEPESTLEEARARIRRSAALHSKQQNVSIVGFTATPTARTLGEFGTLNEQGHREAFDLYSMRQAIAEGFILDVTRNYVTYRAWCKVVKAIANDPELETSAAKRKLAHLVDIDPENVAQKLDVMVAHFTATVAPTLGGRAKAMVVTSGRAAAVRYFLRYQELRAKNPRTLGNVRALVAFTGEVTVDGEKYTEAGLNGFSDEKTADTFDTDGYRLLFVADKYQTGFDQPYLAAMYVDKRLSGTMAVQTLSRLNRICPPWEKQTYVLDFKNDYEDIRASFAPYYEATVLTDPLTMADLRETSRRLLEYQVFSMDEALEFAGLMTKERQTGKDKERMWAILSGAVAEVKSIGDEDTQEEIRRTIRNYMRQYSYIQLTSPFVDEALYAQYLLCVELNRELDPGSGGVDFTIADKVRLEDFELSKPEEHAGGDVQSVPGVKVSKGTGTGLGGRTMERLSKIIEEWNARYGTNLDVGVAAGAVVALQNTLGADPKVQQSAQVNTRSDFGKTVEDRSEDALVAGYDQNEQLYGLLLNNKEAQRQLVGILVDGLYDSLHGGEKK